MFWNILYSVETKQKLIYRSSYGNISNANVCPQHEEQEMYFIFVTLIILFDHKLSSHLLGGSYA